MIANASFIHVIVRRQPDLALPHSLDILSTTTRLFCSSNLTSVLAASSPGRHQLPEPVWPTSRWLSRRAEQRIGVRGRISPRVYRRVLPSLWHVLCRAPPPFLLPLYRACISCISPIPKACIDLAPRYMYSIHGAKSSFSIHANTCMRIHTHTHTHTHTHIYIYIYI